MSQPHPSHSSDSVQSPGGPVPPAAPSRSLDPWVAASRLGGGVLLYGGIGWLLGSWWGTGVLAPSGILVGGGGGAGGPARRWCPALRRHRLAARLMVGHRVPGASRHPAGRGAGHVRHLPLPS